MKKTIKTLMKLMTADSYGFTRSGLDYGKSSRIKCGKHINSFQTLLTGIALFIVCFTLNHHVSVSAMSEQEEVDPIMVSSSIVTGGIEIEDEPVVTRPNRVLMTQQYREELMLVDMDNSVPLSVTPVMETTEAESKESDITVPDTELETIDSGNATLVELALPSAVYGDIDFSSFQPYMDYGTVTAEGTGSYRICRSPDSYSDSHGLRRFKTTSEQFTVNGEDDYVIALGTYYKPKGTIGSRFLVVTSTGMYTAITGDEKADSHTDSMHMFGYCGDNAAMIEWIVERSRLDSDIAMHGTVTKGTIEALQGEILHIYRIEE